MTLKTIKYHCNLCQKRLSIAELLERFCESCEADITPVDASRAGGDKTVRKVA